MLTIKVKPEAKERLNAPFLDEAIASIAENARNETEVRRHMTMIGIHPSEYTVTYSL